MAGKTSSAEAAKTRADWVALVERILSQIEGWAEQNGWPVHRETKEITEEALGTYAVPVLQIKLPGGRLYVEPVAREVVGAEGRIDLYSWPGLHRLLLVRSGGKWALKTDSRVGWPDAWGKRAFTRAAENLTNAP